MTTETTLPPDIKASPMMAQWQACKEVAGDAILLFRMGDFYEAFYDDAATIARELDLTLTRRQGIPMAGVPQHTCDLYIDRLVSKGFKVAIAEQTEDPKKAKGLVRREIVRIVTPGTLINSSLLSDKANNFFAALTKVGAFFGLALLDLTTAEFRVIELEQPQDLVNEIYRWNPVELLMSPKFHEKHTALIAEIKRSQSCVVTEHDEWRFDHQVAHDFLIAHLRVHHLDGFGLKGKIAAINAAGALLHYLQESLLIPIDHIKEISLSTIGSAMALDRNTQRHLELIEPLHEGSRKHTLLSLLDHTKTPMGGRLFRQWIKHPLLSIELITQRQDAVELFLSYSQQLGHLGEILEQVRDLERLMMKVVSGYSTPRDLAALRISLQPVAEIKRQLQSLPLTSLLQGQEQQLDPLPELTHRLAEALVESPPLRIGEGQVFRDGFHPELDSLRMVSRDSHSWLADYQIALREETGIKTLKVGYNRVSGYYIEISKGQAERTPLSFQRRQTLTNAERFITPELKDYENKVLTASERIYALEQELFSQLRQEVAKYADSVMRTAHALAHLDCLRSLAEVARLHHYTRPIIDQSSVLEIIEGRHPIIEAANKNELFVPNDTYMDGQEQRLLIITGPNMAGKSTYIRQIAILTIMAQIGSFIPAKSARIGIVDKVFTRIGASDDLARGQSTFMVEMTETANILHNATSQSLVILDEIGRGTSTYDGISIAWAVAEYLLLTEGKSPKTLFATHYWELTKLEGKIAGAVNYHVAVHESGDHILFLRKVVRGGTDRSYGIHVARLAGLPSSVIMRAQEILVHLEENAHRKTAFEPSQPRKAAPKPKIQPTSREIQLSFFEPIPPKS